jgi:hypothetical protein
MELLEILEALRGHKCLVIDLYVGNLLNHIIPEGSKILKVSQWSALDHNLVRKMGFNIFVNCVEN